MTPELQPKFNLWLEAEGQVALSSWRLALLKAILETGSINSAADRMNVQYRTAWQKVHEMEERLGVKLLDTQIGGQHGGGAKLTPIALTYVDKLTRLQAALEPLVAAKYKEIFEADEAA
jgi:molybdate transport system regulatory protein